jgi:exodeoxyribonuclease-5
MVIKHVEARCLNCKREVKAGQERCACGDPVRIGLALNPGQADPSALQARVDQIMGHPRRETGPTARPDAFQLTGEQERAVAAVKAWFTGATGWTQDASAPFRLFGPAGTGKTTIVKHIQTALGVQAVFGAYTGKAASVLQRKGVPATTIHSAIYRPTDNREARAELLLARDEWAAITLAKAGITSEQEQHMWQAEEHALATRVEELEAQIRRPRFELNPASEWAYADLIVLDEVSMVNTRMAQDIESFGVPVLVLGDPAQLPPVDGGGHYTAAEPDFLLTEIHRQALESPVLALATRIRTGGSWEDDLVPVSLAEAMAADQILVWANRTRWNLILKIRQKLGRMPGYPVAGDKIMCLANNRDAGLLNGQQYVVLGAQRDDLGFTIQARDDDGHEVELSAFQEGFQGLDQEKDAKLKLSAWKGSRGLFTFAQAITVHKAQGSEWPHVYVVDRTDQMKSDARRWAYTAVTRASEKVTLARPGVR